MTTSDEPELDALLTTLIVESGCAGAPDGAVPNWALMGAGLPAAVAAARDVLLAHIAQHYVRWDHLQDEWDEMERSRTHFALPEESLDPPIVAGPLSRRAVRIRLVREDAAPSWEDWRATVGNGRVRHNRTSWVGQIVMDTKEGVDVAWDGRDDVVFYEPYEAMDKLEPEDAR